MFVPCWLYHSICARARGRVPSCTGATRDPSPELHGCNSGPTSFLYIFAIYAFICIVFCLIFIWSHLWTHFESIKIDENHIRLVENNTNPVIESSSHRVLELGGRGGSLWIIILPLYEYIVILLYYSIVIWLDRCTTRVVYIILLYCDSILYSYTVILLDYYITTASYCYTISLHHVESYCYINHISSNIWSPYFPLCLYMWPAFFNMFPYLPVFVYIPYISYIHCLGSTQWYL